MNCERTRELLGPLVDGELPNDLSRRVLAHLDGCATCNARVAALRAIGALVREAQEPAPAGLGPRILAEARVASVQAGRESFARGERAARLVTFCSRAAAVLLGAAAVVLCVPEMPSPSSSSPTATGSPYRLLVTESQGEIDLAGSLRGDFLALARSPESRLLHQLIGGQ